MWLRFQRLVEWFRSSLFLVPTIAVFAAMVVAAVVIGIDRHIDENALDLPFGFASTVDSSRAILGTVAGATITFAGIAFSVSLLIIQQASSQYSPRVVHTLFRDPFNKRIMALVLGNFAYCLLVLRAVRSPLEDGGEPVIPNVSVALAVVLGIATILAIVAFIDHSAHSMDVSRILDGVQHEAIGRVRAEWTDSGDAEPVPPAPPAPERPAHTVRFDGNGWVQQLDIDALVCCVPEGQTMWVDAYPGRYAMRSTPLCRLSVLPGEDGTVDDDTLDADIRAAVSVGQTRTMQQDVSFGLRQLADVALKALSPGINDPTTAQDAIFHSSAVLAELLRREPPPFVRTAEGYGRVVLVHQPTHADLVALAFDEVRRAAATQPAVCIYLLEALSLLVESVEAAGLSDRAAPLREQAWLTVEGCAAADLPPADLAAVEHAYRSRFGAAPRS
ncbi:MAG: DUF2254 domain-containing protein [Actinomycetota bacterium]|nr:DUF2254 domain-containing protein [Actinomycetota bacterium]